MSPARSGSPSRESERRNDVKRWSDEVQKMTDAHTKQIDAALAEKEKDIRTG